MTIPAATVSAPRMSRRVSLRRCRRAIMGSANSTSVAAIGCTRLSGPKTSATPWMTNENASRATPATQRGVRTRSHSSLNRSASSPDWRATPCCTTEPAAKQKPAVSAATTAIVVASTAHLPTRLSHHHHR